MWRQSRSRNQYCCFGVKHNSNSENSDVVRQQAETRTKQGRTSVEATLPRAAFVTVIIFWLTSSAVGAPKSPKEGGGGCRHNKATRLQHVTFKRALFLLKQRGRKDTLNATKVIQTYPDSDKTNGVTTQAPALTFPADTRPAPRSLRSSSSGLGFINSSVEWSNLPRTLIGLYSNSSGSTFRLKSANK